MLLLRTRLPVWAQLIVELMHSIVQIIPRVALMIRSYLAYKAAKHLKIRAFFNHSATGTKCGVSIKYKE